MPAPHRRLAASLLLAVAILLTSSASHAQEEPTPPDEAPGLAVQVDAWWITPRNLDLDFAFIDDSASLSGGGEVRTLENSRVALPRFYAGWRPRREGLPELGGLLWQYDENVSAMTGVLTAQVGALLASPDFAIGRSLVDSAEASSRLAVTCAELLAEWRLELGPASRLRLTAGLRWARFEQDVEVGYRADLFGSALLERITSSTDLQGLGPLVRVRWDHDLSPRVRLGALIGVAAVVGNVDAEAQDAAFENGVFDRATQVIRHGDAVTSFQYEIALELGVRIAGPWGLEAGWEVQSWSDVRPELRFVDEVSQNTALPLTSDVAFEGLRLGIVYRK